MMFLCIWFCISHIYTKSIIAPLSRNIPIPNSSTVVPRPDCQCPLGTSPNLDSLNAANSLCEVYNEESSGLVRMRRRQHLPKDISTNQKSTSTNHSSNVSSVRAQRRIECDPCNATTDHQQSLKMQPDGPPDGSRGEKLPVMHKRVLVDAYCAMQPLCPRRCPPHQFLWRACDRRARRAVCRHCADASASETQSPSFLTGCSPLHTTLRQNLLNRQNRLHSRQNLLQSRHNSLHVRVMVSRPHSAETDDVRLRRVRRDTAGEESSAGISISSAEELSNLVEAKRNKYKREKSKLQIRHTSVSAAKLIQMPHSYAAFGVFFYTFFLSLEVSTFIM